MLVVVRARPHRREMMTWSGFACCRHFQYGGGIALCFDELYCALNPGRGCVLGSPAYRLGPACACRPCRSLLCDLRTSAARTTEASRSVRVALDLYIARVGTPCWAMQMSSGCVLRARSHALALPWPRQRLVPALPPLTLTPACIATLSTAARIQVHWGTTGE